jgi:alpha/beta superfamily hydrolase
MGAALVKIPLLPSGTLEGILDEPASPAREAVIVCHPHPAFGGRMSTPLISAVAQAAVLSGRAALRFHFRGIEGSDGVATGGLIEHEDVAAAHRFLAERGYSRIGWTGYSFGSLMSLRAIAQGGRPFAYVGIALPTSIIDEDPAREAEVERALAADVPSLFLTGAEDPLCDAPRISAWCDGRKSARAESLAGEAHTFSLSGIRAVVRRSIAFLEEAR